jgi:hypothetical protein
VNSFETLETLPSTPQGNIYMMEGRRGHEGIFTLIAIISYAVPFKYNVVENILSLACFLSTGKEGKSSSELVSPLEEPIKRKGGVSVVVEQKLESSEAISETPSKKRSRTKQKSTESTTVEENSVTNVKINKTSIKKETLVGMLSFYLSLLGTSFLLENYFLLS